MSNISGFGVMRKKQEEEGKRQELYAGGVDNRGGGSGLSVLGPPGSSARPGGNAFDHLVTRASEPRNDSHNDDDGPIGVGPNTRRITMYRNGFTVDDGPFRDLTSPESRAFLAVLERGHVPPELQPENHVPGRPVDVSLEDKRSEDYKPPPPPAYVAFSGQGVSLRSESSSSSSGGVITSDALTSVSLPGVDDSKPTTTLQIRLPDGRKLKIKINQSSSVLQLAAVINRDGAVGGNFVLSAGFPPKDLTDLSATVAEANLLGAVITLKKM